VKYAAKSVSLRYDPKQDRIEWTNHCRDKQFVTCWLTRRFLGNILPRLAEWLDAKAEQQAAPRAAGSQTPAEKQHIRRFEHEMAQHQVKAVREPAPQREWVAEFLLDGIQLARVKGGFRLTMTDRDKQHEVVLGLTGPQLHKVVGELLLLSENGQWNVDNPWQSGVAGAPDTAPVH
jgi:hypothetical protein